MPISSMNFCDLLVVVPHSGVLIPGEIPVHSLSKRFRELARNVDWHTDWLYDFRDLLGNSMEVFPFCSLVLEANRDPDDLDSAVPLENLFSELVYRPGLEPSTTLRREVSNKYLEAFHRDISKEIARGKKFMLDAHSTVTARGVADNQIELMSYQVVGADRRVTKFCPNSFIETYAEELAQRLPAVNVTIDESRYHDVYGHVCGLHSIDSITRVGNRVPAILQETNQWLYLYPDGTPNLEAIETLRRAFAEALNEMARKIGL